MLSYFLTFTLTFVLRGPYAPDLITTLIFLPFKALTDLIFTFFKLILSSALLFVALSLSVPVLT